MTPKIEKLQKQIEDLLSLVDRGEGGEREAAKNAYGKKRIDLLEAQVAWLTEQLVTMQAQIQAARMAPTANYAREFRQADPHGPGTSRSTRPAGPTVPGAPTIVVPTITTTANYGSSPPPPPREPGDPCPICGRNISRKIVMGKLDPYLRAGHKCPHGVPCAAADSTKTAHLGGIPPASQACCRKGRSKEHSDREDGSL